jgi:predicted Zn-dependent peptidase
MTLKEREQLAIKAQTELVPLVGAPAVVELNATCQRQSTVSVAEALLDQLESLGEYPPKPSEVEHAVRAITGGFLNHENPQSSLASMLAFEAHFGLANDYYATYHDGLRELDADFIHETVKPYFDKNLSVLVVSADASEIAAALSKLAPVVVLDPDKDFSVKKRLPYAPL